MKERLDPAERQRRLMSPGARVRLDAGINHVQANDDQEVVAFLVARLARGTADERRYATEGLAWIWFPTHPGAVALLRDHAAHDEEPAVRRGSLQAIYQWLTHESKRTSSMPEIVALVAALDDPDVSVRVLALRLVAGLEIDDAAPKLATLLRDPSEEIRVYAALGLARLDAWEAVPELLVLLRDPSPEVRVNVADALSTLKDERAMPALASALEDPSPLVARAAHAALVSIHGSDVGVDPQSWRQVPARTDGDGVLVARRLSRLHARRAFQEGVLYGRSHGAAVAKSAPAGFLLGEMGVETNDMGAAEEGYRACSSALRKDVPLTVHGRPMVVPDWLTPKAQDDLRWACSDGLGAALLRRKHYREAVEPLEEALVAARRANQPTGVARAKYNLACAHANLDHREAALANLRESIELNPSYSAMAKSDADLAPLRDDPRFRALVP